MNKQVKRLPVMLALLAGIPLAGAQTLIPLYSFTDSYDGGEPFGGLAQANDGNLYGTTEVGGTNRYGAIFRITRGVFTPFYSFTGGNDGAVPEAGLVQASDGYLYGTSSDGGTNFDGTVFRITTNGVLTPLWSFTGGHDGAVPGAGLVQANDGYLYGTTQFGGTNGDGTVFHITTNGVLTPLWSFTGGHDGANPSAGLVQADDGKLYGTASVGGTNGDGTVFRITTNGVLTPLWSFTDGHDGAYPYAGLVQASDGNLYGTASGGGSALEDGTVFRITTNGVLTPLYSFTGGNDGANPWAGLLQANDGYLYGSANAGGTNGDGTVFRITTSGTLTPLWSFTGIHDGANPYAALVQAGDGNFYGTADAGGTDDNGTVFELILPPLALSILSDGHQSVLSWPASATNYVLQSTTNLASTNWVTVSIAIPTNSVTVTNSSPARYFRLANP